MNRRLCFVDLETTGLVAHFHEPWEFAVIVRDLDTDVDVEHVFSIRPDLQKADPAALRVNRFYERTAALDAWAPGKPGRGWNVPREVANTLARLLDGAYLVASNPAFDAEFLRRFLHRHEQSGTWQYHLIDVRALALGYLSGRSEWDKSLDPIGWAQLSSPTADMSRAIGVDPPGDQAHTALGDARWALALFDACTGVADEE